MWILSSRHKLRIPVVKSIPINLAEGAPKLWTQCLLDLKPLWLTPSENWKKTQDLRERVERQRRWKHRWYQEKQQESRMANFWAEERCSALCSACALAQGLWSQVTIKDTPPAMKFAPISAYGSLSIWDSWGWSQLLLSSWFGLAHRSPLSITSLQSLEVSLPRLSQVPHTPPPYSVSSGHLPSEAVMSSLAQRPQWSPMDIILRCSQT